MARPLDGIRVLDLTTGPVGGVATAVLADFGAEVVKIEPPGGDRFRAMTASPLWLRGKRSVVLDLSEAEGRRSLQRLGGSSDVLVVSGPLGRDADWGVSREDLARLQPRAIHCGITPWGAKGPLARLPGYEALVAARAGRMHVFGRQLRGKAPGFAALPVAQHACAMGAVQGIVAALFARERSGAIGHVETSLLQGLLPYDIIELLLVQLVDAGAGDLPDPTGGDMPTLNYHPVRASDGRWIQCGNLMEHLFYAFLDSIDLMGELLAEERFQGPPALWKRETIEAARDRILLRVRERPADEWMEAFRRNGNVAAEPYLTSQEALEHPDLIANGAIVTLRDPVLGPVRQIGPIAELSETPARADAPAPRVGEHTDLLPALWPEAAAMPGDPAEGSPKPGGALDGILVVDFSTIIAGPLGTSMLSDLGARVIKVEPPTGDPSRSVVPGGGLAARMNGGKESIALDLKSAEGKAIANELIERADVVVHNFRSGVPERLGLGYEHCRARNPRLVWAAVQGYGTQGPDASRPATHPVVGAAMSGATLQAGPALRMETDSIEELREAARQIMRANEANPDPNTSSVLAAAVGLALLARERGQAEGQRIDVSMLVANAWANVDDFLQYDGKPTRPELDDELRGLAPGYRLYAAREGWVMLAVTSEPEWSRLADAVGESWLERREERSVARLEALFAQRAAAEWETLLAGNRVGCVRADGPGQGRFWAEDETARANGLAPIVEHSRYGRVRRWGALVHVGGPAPSLAPSPLSGEHTDSILRELGRDDAAVRQLRREGIVASEPPDRDGYR